MQKPNKHKFIKKGIQVLTRINWKFPFRKRRAMQLFQLIILSAVICTSIYRIPVIIHKFYHRHALEVRKRAADSIWMSKKSLAQKPQNLPTEIWFNILEYLDYQTLSRLNNSNRYFHSIAMDDRVWTYRIAVDCFCNAASSNVQQSIGMARYHSKLYKNHLNRQEELIKCGGYQFYKHRHNSLQRWARKPSQFSKCNNGFSIIQEQAYLVIRDVTLSLILPLWLGGTLSFPAYKLCQYRNTIATHHSSSIKIILADLIRATEPFLKWSTMHIFLIANLTCIIFWVWEEIASANAAIYLLLANLAATEPRNTVHLAWKQTCKYTLVSGFK